MSKSDYHVLIRTDLTLDYIINELDYVMRYKNGDDVTALKLGIKNALFMLSGAKGVISEHRLLDGRVRDRVEEDGILSEQPKER